MTAFSFNYPISAISAILAICHSPPGPFSKFCCKQNYFLHSTLAPPLRGAWVALGPRLGHPSVTQSQTQSQSAEAYEVPITESVVGFLALPITRCPDHQITRFWRALPHFSSIHRGNHVRTSSLALDMSFATLCLTWFIVQSASACTDSISMLPERSLDRL